MRPWDRQSGARGRRVLAVAAVTVTTVVCQAAFAQADLQIHTVAGGGSCSGTGAVGGPCNGVSATSVPIGDPVSVSAMPNGGYLYVDTANDLVRQVAPSGTVTTVAGTSYLTPQGSVIPSTADIENVPATQSGLDDPVSVAALASGGFLITEAAGSRVRMVNPQGIISTVAGCPSSVTDPTQQDSPEPGVGVCTSAGVSGGTSQELDYPSDAAPAAAGGVLIADTYNCRIMLLGPDGSLSQIAGSGSGCGTATGCVDAMSACNGQSAGTVALDHPYSVSELRTGSGAYVIGEKGSDAIRQVSAENAAGTFSTVVGQPGSPGYGGDGGPAAFAQIGGGSGAFGDDVAGLAAGGFLFTDPYNEVVREVSSSGAISTIAGDGQASYSGDAGAPVSAALNNPVSVDSLPNGNVLIADQANAVIREITSSAVSSVVVQPAGLTVGFTPDKPDGKNGWYRKAPIVSVRASQSGAAVSCELDPAQAPTVFGEIPPLCLYGPSGAVVSANGPHILYAASQNGFGDQETPISLSFKVDTAAPEIACERREPVFRFGSRKAPVIGAVSDSVSGPSSKRVSASATTSSLGARYITVTGSNNAGITGRARCPYFVKPATLSPAPKLSSALRATSGYSIVKLLLLTDIPAGATAEVTCTGRGCRLGARRHLKTVPCRTCKAKGARVADVSSLLQGERLEPGAQIAVSVAKRGTVGRYLRLTVRAGRAPSQDGECLAPGATVPDGHRCSPKLP